MNRENRSDWNTPTGRLSFGLIEASTQRIGETMVTQLAATSVDRLSLHLPKRFLASGTVGTLLKLIPEEQARGPAATELHFQAGPIFSLGRSPEADWVTCFFPRGTVNDVRSKRLSKIHARIEMRAGQLWIIRAGGGMLEVGTREVGLETSGVCLQEGDRLVFAQDYGLDLCLDLSLQKTLGLENLASWRAGQAVFAETNLGAVRFEPVNSGSGFRTSCWLFTEVGIGSARTGVLPAGAELAPRQALVLRAGGCFWLLNLVENQRVRVNDFGLAATEAVPLTHHDLVWLGATRYRVEIS